jgi:hypothetical protein
MSVVHDEDLFRRKANAPIGVRSCLLAYSGMADQRIQKKLSVRDLSEDGFFSFPRDVM